MMCATMPMGTDTHMLGPWCRDLSQGSSKTRNGNDATQLPLVRHQVPGKGRRMLQISLEEAAEGGIADATLASPGDGTVDGESIIPDDFNLDDLGDPW
jgi:hypothetical protein